MLLLLFKYYPVPVTSGKPWHGSQPDVLCALWLQSWEGHLPQSPLIVRHHRWSVGRLWARDIYQWSLSLPESRVYLKIYQINASGDAYVDFSDTHKVRRGFLTLWKRMWGLSLALQQEEGFMGWPERVFQQWMCLFSACQCLFGFQTSKFRGKGSMAE